MGPTPAPLDPAQAQHPGRRDSQQDACGFSNPADEAFVAHGGHLAVLADGMGGLHNGRWAAVHAVQAFIDTYQTKTAAEPIPAALQRALAAANEVVHAEAARLNAVDRMGTTLAVAVVRGLELHWLNAGDSRVYLVEDGHLMCLSTDHNYARLLAQRVHRGELSAGEALGHPLRHALTSYLGRPVPVQHAASGAAVLLRPGARVLLCSDGLTQALDDGQIGALVHGPAQAACDRLLQAALARGLPDQDNTTAVVLHLPRPGHRPDAGTVSQAVYAPQEVPPAGGPAAVAPAPRGRHPLWWAGMAAAGGALLLLGLAGLMPSSTPPPTPSPPARPPEPAPVSPRAGPTIDLLQAPAAPPAAASLPR